MKKELQDKLFEEYPELFKGHLIGGSINIGDGWYHLFDKLCHRIQWYVGYNKDINFSFEQVKEKFGLLRVYYDDDSHDDPYIRGAVAIAEDVSQMICEECGEPGKLSGKGRVKTLCQDHRKEKQ